VSRAVTERDSVLDTILLFVAVVVESSFPSSFHFVRSFVRSLVRSKMRFSHRDCFVSEVYPIRLRSSYMYSSIHRLCVRVCVFEREAVGWFFLTSSTPDIYVVFAKPHIKMYYCCCCCCVVAIVCCCLLFPYYTTRSYYLALCPRDAGSIDLVFLLAARSSYSSDDKTQVSIHSPYISLRSRSRHASASQW